jgi:tetratricopeptide (TPR) repeat protein
LGKEELALREMESALKKRSNDLSLMLQMARLYEKMGNVKSSIEIYRQILALSSENQEARKNLIRLLLELADKNESQGNYEDAMECYKMVLDISPDNETAQEGYLRVRLKTIPQRHE